MLWLTSDVFLQQGSRICFSFVSVLFQLACYFRRQPHMQAVYSSLGIGTEPAFIKPILPHTHTAPPPSLLAAVHILIIIAVLPASFTSDPCFHDAQLNPLVSPALSCPVCVGLLLSDESIFVCVFRQIILLTQTVIVS